MLVPPTVAPLLDRLLDELDRNLPGLVGGLYLHGSIALGDWRTDSDVDYVAVLERPAKPAEFAALRGIHERLGPRPLEGSYVTWAELAERPMPSIGSAHVSEAGFLPHAGFNANPAVWRTIHRHGIAVRGPQPGTLAVHDDDAELATFCRENLDDYWRGWARDARSLHKNAVHAMTGGGLEWAVLGPPRLHCSATTGEIISKSAAADYALATFGSRWQPLLAAALAYRQERRQPSLASRLGLRKQVADFVTTVCDGAAG